MATPIDKFNFQFKANIESDIFITNPESSRIGKTMIEYSIYMIANDGFEAFTFKKLAEEIESTEATIYRYFANKHKLLLYLTAWYWSWVEYIFLIKNSNIQDAEQKLFNILEALSMPKEQFGAMYDLKKLYNIICDESSKAYLTKKVDELNKIGVYKNYKRIVAIISEVILEINPTYMYPRMLATTLIEGIHDQTFFAKHLPSLTDKNDSCNYIIKFFKELCIDNLQKHNAK